MDLKLYTCVVAQFNTHIFWFPFSWSLFSGHHGEQTHQLFLLEDGLPDATTDHRAATCESEGCGNVLCSRAHDKGKWCLRQVEHLSHMIFIAVIIRFEPATLLITAEQEKMIETKFN